MTATRRSRTDRRLLSVSSAARTAFLATSVFVCSFVLAGSMPLAAQQDDPPAAPGEPDARQPEAGVREAGVREPGVATPAAARVEREDAPRIGGLRRAEASPRAIPEDLRRITIDGTAMRCFASQQSPVYEEVLAAGTVVAPIEQRGDYTRILLPEGPIGFVHRDFVTEPDLDGIVRTKGKGVSFRYRPRSGEAPVKRLAPNTELAIIGEPEDAESWWQVRFREAPVWVPAEVLEDAGERGSAETAWRTLGETLREDNVAWARSMALREAEEAAAKARQERFAKIKQRVVEESAKPVEEQDFEALLVEIEAYGDDLADDAPEVEAIAQLQVEVERMEQERRAILFVKTSEAPPAKVEKLPAPTPRDPLADFDAVGWVRVRKQLAGPVRVTLEKGGTTRFYLQCTTGRFDLTQFDGLEVGVSGPTRRPHLQSVRTLDVDRLEVLGASR